MVTRLAGKSKPEFLIAVLTRSLASSMALSGKPTIEKEGKPWEETSISTETSCGEKPTFTPDEALTSINLCISNF